MLGINWFAVPSKDEQKQNSTETNFLTGYGRALVARPLLGCFSPFSVHRSTHGQWGLLWGCFCSYSGSLSGPVLCIGYISQVPKHQVSTTNHNYDSQYQVSIQQTIITTPSIETLNTLRVTFDSRPIAVGGAQARSEGWSTSILGCSLNACRTKSWEYGSDENTGPFGFLRKLPQMRMSTFGQLTFLKRGA